jgi:hypothetical protein
MSPVDPIKRLRRTMVVLAVFDAILFAAWLLFPNWERYLPR